MSELKPFDSNLKKALQPILAIWWGLWLLSIPLDGMELPELLRTESGSVVSNVPQWEETRRTELLNMLESMMFGKSPVDRPETLRFEKMEKQSDALPDTQYERIGIHFSGPGGDGVIRLHAWYPEDLTDLKGSFLLIHHRTPIYEPGMGKPNGFWPVDLITSEGYAAFAFHVADVDPDEHDGFLNGVHGVFDGDPSNRNPDSWGTLAAWAWGTSRVMDYLETDPRIDGDRVALVGHSRGGKTALWCGAKDTRFSMVVSNCSGANGAALSRRHKGEKIDFANERFPHWFAETYRNYNKDADSLPFDQHFLLALIAPRHLYVASKTEDDWADPEGEYLSLYHARKAWQLYGYRFDLGPDLPPPNQPVFVPPLAYHIQSGKHDLTRWDWSTFMDYASNVWNDESL